MDFVLGVEDQDRFIMMRGNLNRLEEGDPTLQQVFSSNLDKTLVLNGRAPVNLPASDMKFVGVRARATTVAPKAVSSEDDAETGDQVVEVSASGVPDAGEASEVDATPEKKTSFFSTSNPVFLAIFATVIVIAALVASKVMSRRPSASDSSLLPVADRKGSKDSRRNSNEVDAHGRRLSSGNTSSTASRRGEKSKKKKKRRDSKNKNDESEKYTAKVDPVSAFDPDAERDLEAIKAKIRADFSEPPSPDTSRELSESPVVMSPVASPEPSNGRGNEVSVARSEMSDKVISLKKAVGTKDDHSDDGSSSDSSNDS